MRSVHHRYVACAGMKRTTAAVIGDLRTLADDVDRLMSGKSGSAEHVRWIARVRAVLSEVFGAQSDYFRSFTELPWQRTGRFIVGGPANPGDAINPARAIAREPRPSCSRSSGSTPSAARGICARCTSRASRSSAGYRPARPRRGSDPG